MRIQLNNKSSKTLAAIHIGGDLAWLWTNHIDTATLLTKTFSNPLIIIVALS